VRDALRQLELEGLVEPGRRGVYVRGLTDADLVELYALRAALESLAVRDCIARAAHADWSVLDTAVRRMRAAAEAAVPAAFAAADLDFHTGFYEIGGNRRLAATWATHRDLFAAMLDVTNSTDRDLRPVAQDHADLADVVRAGEVQPALDALSGHLDGSLNRMRAALAGQRAASADTGS
jgi:GntR family transcriptional regulator of gluconate operon